ncbi:MAG TPA: decarboxylating NADP(+)-dependent phosphogluconate dehydrogenase [Planctomycetia bacterium]|nr:decarboxylating NADP(+)-dependent phosphogluconate dehydrogenase [Planctomycetia bacterium]
MAEGTCDFGLVGLAVMGENLVRNVESRGFTAAVYNRTTQKVDDFLAEHGKGKNFVGCRSPQELVKALKRPRRMMFMVKAGPAVDDVIKSLVPLLEPGDILIDGGNSYYVDTERRAKELADKGLLFLGVGVSGGEEGALKGPSIMPGGASEAWPAVKAIFQAIAAKVGPKNDIPCCEWVGPGGSGHYVKMVHNGIEYGDMQLICEAYQLLKDVVGLTNEQMHETFAEWNKGDLDSYLIEITRDIFTVKDPDTGDYLVDKILDTAGQKGTGKWTSQLALDLGVPTTLVTEAVFARCLSAQKEARVRASKILAGPDAAAVAAIRKETDVKKFVDEVRQALYASKICSYAQGYVQLAAAAAEHKWELNYGNIALLWRGGCIIRARFLERIKEAFDRDPKLENLLLDPYFREATAKAQNAWRNVVATATRIGVPTPAFSAALTYYDGYRTARLPANLLQAQRDYFGSHTYQRLDKAGTFHTDWIGEKNQG